MTPERLGPFLLCERLPGGRAEAWRARRVIAPGQLSAPVLVEVFRSAPREVQARLVEAGEWGARVAHPGVVRVIEVGTLDGTLYAVSELADGHDLGSVLAAASPGEAGPSVPAALAIGAQLARVAREVHEESGGREQLGLFRPGDVVLGYDGRVRIRARGVVERPQSAEARDPFLAPEIARGAELGPPADVWTVARVLRAVLAVDPGGRKTPKVSTLYKDSLGPILTEALARDPGARLSIAALERRLLDVALDDAEDLAAPVIELLEEHAGGAIPPDDDRLGFSDAEAIAGEPGPSGDVSFPRPAGSPRSQAKAHPRTEVGPPPGASLDDVGSELFGRALAEAAREIALVSDDGDAASTGSYSRPRVVVPADDELSLEEASAAGDVRLGSVEELLDADVDAPLDLDAIARSSLEGPPEATDDPLAVAGTAIVERPPPLPPSQHEEGDVFQAAAPATRVSRLSSRERSSLERLSRSGARPRASIEAAPAPEPDVFADGPRAPDDDLDVFTATVRPGDLLPELLGSRSTRVMRSGAKSSPPQEPPNEPREPSLDPNKTAYLDDPAAAFRSGSDKRAVRPLSADAPEFDHDEQPTERLSEDLIREAVRLARGAPAEEPAEATRSGTSVDEAELGRLVIDVPEGAVVFVNGEQRGRGRTVLEGLDRFASFVVRVHHRGHLPWTGTVTLKGMAAARIEPDLTPKR